jgi:hypothetical protein
MRLFSPLITDIKIGNVPIALHPSLPYRYAIRTTLAVALIASLASVWREIKRVLEGPGGR